MKKALQSKIWGLSVPGLACVLPSSPLPLRAESIFRALQLNVPA